MPEYLGSEVGPFKSEHPLNSGAGGLARQGANFVITKLQMLLQNRDGIRGVNVWFRELKVGSLGNEREVRIAQPADSGAGPVLELTNEVVVGLRLGMDEDPGRPYDIKQRWLHLYLRELKSVRLGSRQGPARSMEPYNNGGGAQVPQLDNVVITALQFGKDDIGKDERQHWLNIWWSEVLGTT